MSNLDYKPPEPTKAQLEYARPQPFPNAAWTPDSFRPHRIGYRGRFPGRGGEPFLERR